MMAVVFLILSFSTIGFGQDIPDSVYEREGLEQLMSLMNLRLSDLTFRNDYTKIDSFRLATVENLMKRPYGMIEFVEQCRDTCLGARPEPILSFAFDNLAKEGQTLRGWSVDKFRGQETKTGIDLFYKSEEFNRLLLKINRYLNNVFPSSADSAFALLGSEEKKFLTEEFKELMVEDTADEHRTPEQIDSIQNLEEDYTKQFVRFGYKIRKDFLIAAGAEAAVDIFREINLFVEELKTKNINIDKMLRDTVHLPSKGGIGEFLGRNKGWAIGGMSDDRYKGDYSLIIDFGGNDKYDLSYDPSRPHGVIIIDLGGNDIYSAADFCVASGCLSAGLLYDLWGNDIYSVEKFSCGSGYFGFGFLYDGAGHDKYYGDSHTQGAGTFGAGVLMDIGGNDLYSAALYAQGFGGPEGFGLIAEYGGGDSYIAGYKYKDILRYEDHFLSLSQGFAYGFRPYVAGGIGAIIELGGNDSYLSDIFAQGTSYWRGLGLIYDSSGNDQYNSYQYAQGAATHMTLGILMDETGHDFYRGKGLMQGCGHDYSCAIMLDRNGNDIYHAYDLSQAAGSANGFGIQIDDRGDDAYYVMKKHNTQGFGDARRDFGSIGLFLDLGGLDRYDGNGGDNLIWKTPSKWGGGFDWEFIKKDSIIPAGR
jgi:hypothetical protein